MQGFTDIHNHILFKVDDGSDSIEKSIEMIKQKDLLALTGYVHGGCSMIGMKKFFKTTIDISAKEYETIFFSAGKIGYQVEMSIEDLKKIIRYQLADIVTS